jgi:hypothetical protein
MKLLSLKVLVPICKTTSHHIQKGQIFINNLLNKIDLLTLPQHILYVCMSTIYCESENLLVQEYIREKKWSKVVSMYYKFKIVVIIFIFKFNF